MRDVDSWWLYCLTAILLTACEAPPPPLSGNDERSSGAPATAANPESRRPTAGGAGSIDDKARYDETAGQLFVEEFRRFLASPAVTVVFGTDFDDCGGASAVAGEYPTMRLDNAEDVRTFLSESEWIPGYRWHHCYNVYGCDFSGELEDGARSYRFDMDAGGAGTLSLDDQAIFFGHPQMADCNPDGDSDPSDTPSQP